MEEAGILQAAQEGLIWVIVDLWEAAEAEVAQAAYVQVDKAVIFTLAVVEAAEVKVCE